MLEEAREFEDLCRKAAKCRYCFEAGWVADPTIDIAQPRWIGPGYSSASCRVLILMLNPGSGEGRSDLVRQLTRRLSEAFRDGNGSLREIFEFQRRDMPEWGRGRFLPFYKDLLGLPSVNRLLDVAAFANIAWCATRGDRYPGQMLDECYSRHTENLLSVLKPDMVVLSGVPVHAFYTRIERLLPKARIRRAYHFANWRGKGWY